MKNNSILYYPERRTTLRNFEIYDLVLRLSITLDNVVTNNV